MSINPDDPGKFGCIDNTEDYFVSFVSFNWTLKHLKLCAIHSINHAICSEEEKEAIVKSFNAKWNTWVKDFLAI